MLISGSSNRRCTADMYCTIGGSTVYYHIILYRQSVLLDTTYLSKAFSCSNEFPVHTSRAKLVMNAEISTPLLNFNFFQMGSQLDELTDFS